MGFRIYGTNHRPLDDYSIAPDKTQFAQHQSQQHLLVAKHDPPDATDYVVVPETFEDIWDLLGPWNEPKPKAK